MDFKETEMTREGYLYGAGTKLEPRYFPAKNDSKSSFLVCFIKLICGPYNKADKKHPTVYKKVIAYDEVADKLYEAAKTGACVSMQVYDRYEENKEDKSKSSWFFYALNHRVIAERKNQNNKGSNPGQNAASKASVVSEDPFDFMHGDDPFNLAG